MLSASFTSACVSRAMRVEPAAWRVGQANRAPHFKCAVAIQGMREVEVPANNCGCVSFTSACECEHPGFTHCSISLINRLAPQAYPPSQFLSLTPSLWLFRP